MVVLWETLSEWTEVDIRIGRYIGILEERLTNVSGDG